MSLAALRRRGAPVALVAYVTLVANMVPVRSARADDSARQEEPATVDVKQDAPPPSAPAPSSPVHVERLPLAGGPAEATAPAASGVMPQQPITTIASKETRVPQPDSLPVDGTSKSGVSSQAIALPQGTGKIQGMGESFSTQLSTGVANFSVPIALMQARGGAQPSLALSYSSGGGDGVAGMGWDIGVPFIARQTDRGLPHYQDPQPGGAWQPTQDRFIFNGGQELIPICLVSGGACSGAVAQGPDAATSEQMPAWASGWQYFRPRVEGGFLRFFWSPDHRTWRVQSKSGTSMELGVPLDGSGYNGALETDATGSDIFRWDLVREYDAYGTPNPSGSALPAPVNIVSYRYLSDGGMAYLSDIYDTPPPGTPTAALSAYAHHVRLSYETRTDPITSYRRGWQTLEQLRLTGIDVTSQTFVPSGTPQMVRRYHLAYDPSFHVSLLNSVQMEGRCNTTEGGAGAVSEDGTGDLPATSCPTLPAMTFGYQHVAGYTIAGATQQPDLPGYEAFDERVIDFANSPPNSIDEDLTDLFDVNADGLPDLLVTNPALFNGNFGVYINGEGGQANAFGAVHPMTVSGVPGETAATISLQNLNVSAADINGDGVVDLLHMPQVQTYSVYTPVTTGVGASATYAWIGSAVTTASQQSPKIDFGDDASNIQLADVNGDGLVDVMYSAGTELQTFFSLGRYPGGNDQFGNAQWTGPATAQISNDPVAYCVPYGGLPIQFNDSNTKLADMNGDGLQDIVYAQQGNIQYWPGRGNGYFGTGDPNACPAGNFGESTSVMMASSPWYSDPNGSTLHFDDVNGDGLDDMVQIGFEDVEIWLNVDGSSWTDEHIIQNTPAEPSYQTRVRLVDANGTGTRDVLWGDAGGYKFIDLQGGVRPWTLVHVQNGLGKTTDLQYASSSQLMLAAAAAGSTWTSLTPEPVHVVTQSTDRDNLNIVGRPAGVYVTQYSYANPVYDGRQREFRGFSSATSTRVGDSNSPTSTTSSTFLLGQCTNDENLPVSPCTDPGRWEDNPREALKGLPLVSETYDTSGDYLSTQHHTYRLRKLYAGLDGREVRYAFESQSDSFLYDDGPFVSAPGSMTLTDVELEVQQGSVSTDTTEAVPERSSIAAPGAGAHTHSVSTVDMFGNATATTDYGVQGVDDAITSTTTPGLASSADGSGWMFRTVASYVTSAQYPIARKSMTFTYDAGGNPYQTTGMLAGTAQLQRFYSDGPVPSSGVAQTPPPSTSQGGPILVDTKQYSPQGELILETGPDGRCRQIVYDAAFGDLPMQEMDFVGTATAISIDNTPVTCGQTALVTTAVYDRGLGVVAQVTEPRGELSTVAYDGLARITSISKPDPNNLGSASSTPSVTVAYFLPTNPTTTPYTVVHTQTQDGSTASCTPGVACTPPYRDAWAFTDGFGRAIVTLDQADPSAGDLGQWIVNGLTSYDAKGAAQRAYLAWFWNGNPQQFALATTAPTAFDSQRYDAFGRQLQTYGLDGTLTLQSVYHALSVDEWDAADLMPGPHQGTPATATQDGHGRTVKVTERIHNGNVIEAHDTITKYQSTGEPQVITRLNEATGAAVTRWLVYDTLGRMVLNVEPDTTAAFIGPPAPGVDPITALSSLPPTLHAWTYAYDDAGDLVGTSDARGCGENYFYDAAGRISAEDFSPCMQYQPAYTSPNVQTGDGTEAFYYYDTLDPSVPASVAGTPPFVAAVTSGPWGLYRGRLSAESDRGARTATAYDGRGRVTATARVLAAPVIPGTTGPNGVTLATRYASQWFEQTTSYDAADRPISESTGASALIGSNLPSTSVVSTQYSQRGTVLSVGSTYGALVTRITRAADGPIGQIVYGDLANTTSAFTYDTRRRLSSVQTYRGPPALWSSNGTSYSDPSTTGATPTAQLLLQDLDYGYDAVDNPTQITDYRNPAEWPAGAQPVTRKIQYDDLYRVTQVGYSYPSGIDPWVDPFQAEDQGTQGQQDPRRSLPSPHVAFPHRVLQQSFAYDWLGNTTQTDDDAHGFYDRSLGTIANGTAGQGPYQLQAARDTDPSFGGNLTTAYDAAGNLVGLSVVRFGASCLGGATCSQQFAYQWDEAGRLSDARRWDTNSPAPATTIPEGPASAELQYAYDANDGRTMKTSVGTGQGGVSAYTAYILDSLELRHAAWLEGNYQDDVTTEVVYLAAHKVRLANLHYALEDEPSAMSGGVLHVLMELPDHLGSASIVIDHDTSELVEARSHLGYGEAESDYRPTRWASFREDYGFTGKEEDIELGLAYFGKRYLNTELGRWVSADPLTTHKLGADANCYAYVHGELYRSTDPLGLQAPGVDLRTDARIKARDDAYLAGDQKQVAQIDEANRQAAAATIVIAGGELAASQGAIYGLAYAALFAKNDRELGAAAAGWIGGLIFGTAIARITSGSGAAANDATSVEPGTTSEPSAASTPAGTVSQPPAPPTPTPVSPPPPVLAKPAAEPPSGGLDTGLVIEPVSPDVPSVEVKPLSKGELAADVAGLDSPFAADAHPTFRPGPYAGRSIPARSSAQKFTAAERQAINDIFAESGCHTCGARIAGTKSGRPVPDHQPVSALNFDNRPQRLFPQCLQCSNDQMRAVAEALQALRQSQ